MLYEHQKPNSFLELNEIDRQYFTQRSQKSSAKTPTKSQKSLSKHNLSQQYTQNTTPSKLTQQKNSNYIGNNHNGSFASNAPNTMVNNNINQSHINNSQLAQITENFNLKYYNRFYKQQEHKRILQKQVEKDIQLMANSKKMSENSYRILVKKLEENLVTCIMQIDNKNCKIIKFEQLGRLLGMLKIFKVIQYDENNLLTNLEQFNSKVVNTKQRKIEEMELHEQLWMMMGNYELDKQFILVEIVYTILRILMDPIVLSAEETSEILVEFLGKKNEDLYLLLHSAQEREKDMPPLNPEELVRKFKKLSFNKFAYQKTNPNKIDTKQEKIQDYYKNEKYTHKPTLNPTSLVKDAQQTQKFIEQNKMIPQKDFQRANNNNSEQIFGNRAPNQQRIRNQQFRNGHTNFYTEQDEEEQNQNEQDPFNYHQAPTTEYKQSFQEKQLPDKQEVEEEINRMLFTRVQNERSKSKKDNDGADNKYYSGNNKNKKIDRVDILLKRKELKDEWVRKEQQNKMQKDMEQCTFQPKTTRNYNNNRSKSPYQVNNTHNVFDRLNKQKATQGLTEAEKEKIKKMEKLQNELKELEKCTFAPKINKSKSSKSLYEKPDIKVNGFEKNIGRLRHATKQNEEKKQLQEFKPSGEGYEKIRQQAPNPPQMLTRPKINRKPFLIMDINIAPGRTGKIGLHEDDNPRKIARSFCKQFTMDEEQEEAIYQVLQEQFDAYNLKQQQKQLKKQQKLHRQQQQQNQQPGYLQDDLSNFQNEIEQLESQLDPELQQSYAQNNDDEEYQNDSSLEEQQYNHIQQQMPIQRGNSLKKWGKPKQHQFSYINNNNNNGNNTQNNTIMTQSQEKRRQQRQQFLEDNNDININNNGSNDQKDFEDQDDFFNKNMPKINQQQYNQKNQNKNTNNSNNGQLLLDDFSDFSSDNNNNKKQQQQQQYSDQEDNLNDYQKQQKSDLYSQQQQEEEEQDNYEGEDFEEQYKQLQKQNYDNYGYVASYYDKEVQESQKPQFHQKYQQHTNNNNNKNYDNNDSIEDGYHQY